MLSKYSASLILGLGTGLILLVSGCGGGSSGPSTKDPLLMFVNACSDGPVAFYTNDDDASGTLTYKAKTAFKSVPFISQSEGGYDLSVEEPDRSIAYDSIATGFQKDTSTVIVGVGIKNPPDTERVKQLKLVQFIPDRTAPIGNRARIIFLHAFTRKAGFDTPPLVLQPVGDQPLFQTANTNYGTVNAIEVDSGTYKYFGANDARNNYLIAKDPDNDQVYGLPAVDGAGNPKPVTLNPGGIYLAMISGVESANGKPSEIVFISIDALVP